MTIDFIAYIAEETVSLQWMETNTSISDVADEHQTDNTVDDHNAEDVDVDNHNAEDVDVDNHNAVDGGTEYLWQAENTEEHQNIEEDYFNTEVSLLCR